MDSKQFAWMYLIEHGTAGGKPSYYGGVEIKDKQAKTIKGDYFKVHENIKKEYLKEIKRVGVDWQKTAAPVNDSLNMFTGTFSEPEKREYIWGELVLNNRTVQTWSVDALEVTNVFDMMAEVDEVKKRFKCIF